MKLLKRRVFQKEILDVSDATFWRLTRAKELPTPIKIGGQEYYSMKDIEAWLNKKKEGKNA